MFVSAFEYQSCMFILKQVDMLCIEGMKSCPQWAGFLELLGLPLPLPQFCDWAKPLAFLDLIFSTNEMVGVGGGLTKYEIWK